MDDPNSVKRLLDSMRNTLALMERMGVPKQRLAEVLELALKELKKELARNASERH